MWHKIDYNLVNLRLTSEHSSNNSNSDRLLGDERPSTVNIQKAYDQTDHLPSFSKTQRLSSGDTRDPVAANLFRRSAC